MNEKMTLAGEVGKRKKKKRRKKTLARCKNIIIAEQKDQKTEKAGYQVLGEDIKLRSYPENGKGQEKGRIKNKRRQKAEEPLAMGKELDKHRR